MGQPFNGLYVVRLGALKSVVTHDDGNENVIAFSMKGDLLGTDGVCKKQYWCEAVALTDCEVVRLPAEEFFSPGRTCDDIERVLYWAIAREITREQASYTVSHAARAEVRVARFLLQQSESFSDIGCSPRRFTLTMTRRDIGSYLSVTLETVSRALSVLNHQGIIEISNRDVTIKLPEALRAYEG
jgi:CRP/FNR family transcriptional regulator